VIVSLDGGVSPLRLPRHRPAPIALHLEGGLRSADDSLLPRVTTVEIALPSPGISPPAACRAPQPRSEGALPGQRAFAIHARLLLFNGDAKGGRPVVVLHGYVPNPADRGGALRLRHRRGDFGTALIGRLPPALGPWVRFAHFELTVARHYRYQGRARSFLSGSCPAPPTR
jgi:hypothetical protein